MRHFAVVLAMAFQATRVAGQEASDSALEKLEQEVSQAVEKARKSVVGITASFSAGLNGEPMLTESITFSGIVFASDGHIVTDGAAVENAAGLSVTLPDGQRCAGILVGVDRRSGVGLLRVAQKDLVPAEFAAAARTPRQGSCAIIVGNTLGLRASSEVGLVSGLERAVRVGGRRYDDLLQLSVNLRPGDCGAFVANSRGHLIGMIHSAYQGEGEEIEALGILQLFGKEYGDILPMRSKAVGFATSSETVRFVADRIMKHGRMVGGWAGLIVRPLDPAVRKQLSIPDGQGCEVVSVESDGPARKLLRTKDVILSVDGDPVVDVRALRKWVRESELSRGVRVVYLRAGVRHEGEFTIAIDR